MLHHNGCTQRHRSRQAETREFSNPTLSLSACLSFADKYQLLYFVSSIFVSRWPFLRWNFCRVTAFYRATTLGVSAVFAVVRCLSVCPSVRLSVTLVYCIHMAEDIVKLLSWPGSPSLVFLTHNRYPIPKGTPSAKTQNTPGWENFAIFD